MKDFISDALILIVFLSMAFGPLVLFIIRDFTHSKEIRLINERYDQIIYEIKKCKTKECVDEQ
jgi:hypothetical protein